jgi:hypothetical protein
MAKRQTRHVNSWIAWRTMENPQVSASQASAGVDCVEIKAVEQPRHANKSELWKNGPGKESIAVGSPSHSDNSV